MKAFVSLRTFSWLFNVCNLFPQCSRININVLHLKRDNLPLTRIKIQQLTSHLSTVFHAHEKGTDSDLTADSFLELRRSIPFFNNLRDKGGAELIEISLGLPLVLV